MKRNEGKERRRVCIGVGVWVGSSFLILILIGRRDERGSGLVEWKLFRKPGVEGKKMWRRGGE